jgi:hypothetical protein
MAIDFGEHPTPPASYRLPVLFTYPRVLLAILSGIALLVSLLVFGALLWLLQGQPGQFQIVLRPIDGVVVLLTIPGTVLAHEAIHGALLRLLGYRPTFGIDLRMPAAYAVAPGQFQTRDHFLVVALAPLVVITVGMVPLLAIQNSTIGSIAFTALLMNTSGAVGDLLIAWRVVRLPRAALLCDISPERVLIYEPDLQ